MLPSYSSLSCFECIYRFLGMSPIIKYHDYNMLRRFSRSSCWLYSSVTRVSYLTDTLHHSSVRRLAQTFNWVLIDILVLAIFGILLNLESFQRCSLNRLSAHHLLHRVVYMMYSYAAWQSTFPTYNAYWVFTLSLNELLRCLELQAVNALWQHFQPFLKLNLGRMCRKRRLTTYILAHSWEQCKPLMR